MSCTKKSKSKTTTHKILDSAQTFNLFEKNNKTAFISLQNTNKCENYKFYQNLAFLRKDLFNKYLSDKNLTFVWIKIMSKELRGEKNDFPYIESKSFNEIIFYEEL